MCENAVCRLDTRTYGCKSCQIRSVHISIFTGCAISALLHTCCQFCCAVPWSLPWPLMSDTEQWMVVGASAYQVEHILIGRHPPYCNRHPQGRMQVEVFSSLAQLTAYFNIIRGTMGSTVTLRSQRSPLQVHSLDVNTKQQVFNQRT